MIRLLPKAEPGTAETGALPAGALALVLASAGAVHLLRPGLYAGLIPRRLGPWRPWVLGSGLAELACAALLSARRTRAVGGYAAAALLVAVLPGNVEMARRLRGRGRREALAWARVPLQVPLVVWALRIARRG